MKRFASEALIDMCRDDPDLKRAVITKEFGLKLPERDPVKDLREDLLHQVNEIAKKQLDTNPKKAEAVAAGWIRQQISDLGFGEVDRNSQQPNDVLTHLLEQAG